jgi:hypothetical protein
MRDVFLGFLQYSTAHKCSQLIDLVTIKISKITVFIECTVAGTLSCGQCHDNLKQNSSQVLRPAAQLQVYDCEPLPHPSWLWFMAGQRPSVRIRLQGEPADDLLPAG